MSGAATWSLVGLCAVITALIKAVGPVTLGGRRLPERFQGVITLMAPALLAALVATQALANGRHWTLDADTAGVAAGGVLIWRGVPMVAGVVVAAAVTALVRAL